MHFACSIKSLSVLGHKRWWFSQGKFAEGKLINLNLTVLSFIQKNRRFTSFPWAQTWIWKSLNFTEIQIVPTQKLCFETFYDVSNLSCKVKHVEQWCLLKPHALEIRELISILVRMKKAELLLPLLFRIKHTSF